MSSFIGLIRRWIDPTENSENQSNVGETGDDRAKSVNEDNEERNRQRTILKDSVERFQQEIEQLKQKLNHQTEEAAKREKIYKKLLDEKDELLQVFMNQFTEKENHLKSEERKVEIFIAQVDHKNAELKQKELQCANAERQIEALRQEIVMQKTRNESLAAKESEMKRYTQQLAQLRQNCENETKLRISHEKQMDELRKMLQQEKNKAEAFEIKCKNAVKEMTELNVAVKKQTSQLNENLQTTEVLKKQHETSLKEKDSKFQALSRQLKSLSETLDGQTKKWNTDKKNIERLKEEMKMLNHKNDEDSLLLLELKTKIEQQSKELETERRIKEQQQEELSRSTIDQKKIKKKKVPTATLR